MSVEQQAPKFVVTREAHFKSLWEGLTVLCHTSRPLGDDLRIYRGSVAPNERRPMRAFFSSLLLHFALIFALVRIPFSRLLHRFGIGELDAEDRAPAKVFELHRIDLADYLPALQTPGPGGHPGRGTQPKPVPPRGSTALDPRLTIVSNPPQPDNDHQTIAQLPLQPELKIPSDLPLPNVVLGAKVAIPESPGPSSPEVPEFVPQVPQVPSESASSVTVPKPPDLTLNLATPPVLTSSLAVPLPPPPTPAESAKPPASAALAELGAPAGNSSEGLLALSLNPAPLTPTIAVPGGTRAGAFSISPAGGTMGSPGGISKGESSGGTAGEGSGGDASTGSGSGASGGGGNGPGSGTPAEVGIVGKATSDVPGTAAALAPLPAALVYRVTPPPRPRQMAMVVTSGPTGGGGLRAYGVLRGGKVYTIYLPMSGHSWILQYCATDPIVQERKKLHTTRDVAVRLSLGLVPPSPEEQFDFHRQGLPSEAANPMIILHGVIDKDGLVGNLQLLQGVQEILDKAALAAFAQWKFKPALMDGKPVEVEILVGIPATASGS